MNLESQVVSLDLAKKLKELGVKQESYFRWELWYQTSEKFNKGVSLGKEGIFGEDYHIVQSPNGYTTADVKWNQNDLTKLTETSYSAYTVAELGEMLPREVDTPLTKDGGPRMELQIDKWLDDIWQVSYDYRNSMAITTSNKYITAPTEADARARMLIYLIENKLITL
jgi:hypothetical protein